MNVSKLVLYSYGVVAANKPLSTMLIEVTPMEQVPMADGELTDNLNTTNVGGKDADGASFQTTVNNSATLTARWLPFSSNRKTAPDVRRGEKVAIWKFADADKYYWSELEYDAKLRKLETVVYAFSATRNEADDATPETTYFLEISTHNKLIHLHTCQADGEPFGYDFVLNTKDGNFQIRDTIENIIFLDSPSKRIVMKNAEGSFIDLFAQDLFINVVRNMTTKVGGDMTTIVAGNLAEHVTGNRTRDVGGNETIQVSGNETIKVDGSYDMTSQGAWNTTAPSNASFVTPTLSCSAIMSVGASLSTGAAGGGGSSGATTIRGPINVENDITIQGSLVASGTGTFSGNVSAPNIN